MHALAQAALAVVVIVAVVLAGAAWRLSRGPVPMPWLARAVVAALPADVPVRISLGDAALEWAGFRAGLDQPFDIRLTGLAVSNAAGRRIASVPHAAVSLSTGWLLLGHIVPRTLTAEGAAIHLRRAATAGAGDSTLPGILDQLARRPHSDHAPGHGEARWSQLQRVRIVDATVSVEDAGLGQSLQATHLAIDLTRGAAGGISGTAGAELTLAGQQAILAATAAVDHDGGQTHIAAHLSPLNPAAFAAALPQAAALAALDAPVTLMAGATLGADLALVEISGDAVIGAGTVHAASGTAPLLSAHLTAEGTPDHITVTLPGLVTAARPDGPRSTLSGHAEIARSGGPIAVSATLDLDRVALADLPALWPEGVGGPDARPWITQNITDGSVHDLHAELSLTTPEDFSALTITHLAGTAEGSDVTAYWLRPVPPVQHIEAHLALVSADRLDITASSGRAAFGQDPILLRGGRIVLTGLGDPDQFANIDVDLAGTVPSAVALLSHKRLHLLDHSPLRLVDPAGQFTGHVNVNHLKLREDVTFDDVNLHSSVKLTDLHLGGIAAGRDLDRGTFDVQAGNDGMHAAGQASIAEIPVRLALDMDFRAGPPTQVEQSVTLNATLTPAQLAGLGLDTGDALSGSASVSARLAIRSDQQGEATLSADLGALGITADVLDWRKPPGQAATLTAHLLLDHQRLDAVDMLRAEGEGLQLAGSASFRDGKPYSVTLDRLVLGTTTEAAGTLRFNPYRATLNGRSLNLSGLLRHDTSAAQPTQQPGPAYSLDARFDRVVFGPDRLLTGITLSADHDGSVMRRLDLGGSTDHGQAFRVTIVPSGRLRRLSGTAADVGAVLRALDVTDKMDAGRLVLSGSFDDAAPHHPLTGRAEIADFRIRHAPALARLLQVMTLYGVVDLLQGPGLFFRRLVAPFRFADQTLELSEARAFSASLGMTAKGRIDLAAPSLDLQGTIVPAYFFNTLLGDLPLIGRLFSPERGGGLFAATYTLHGPLDDPQVSVNPLAALTPGFLRGLFGLLDRSDAKQ